MEHVQKIIYILSLFLPVMVFFSLGLWFAWMVWFKHCTNFDQAMEEHYELVKKLNSLYTNQTKLLEKHVLSQAQVATEMKDQEVSETTDSKRTYPSDLHELKSKLEQIEAEKEKEHAELLSLRKENEALTQKLTLIVDSNDDDTFSEIKTVEAILNDFADEPVSNDPELGILFQEEPEIMDDLTAIDLLSPEIAKKINQLGVYRYKQIALWSPEQYDQIIQKIGVNPNHLIGKNGEWQKQAAELHSKHHPIH